MKFDSLDVFAAWAQEHDIPVTRGDALEKFSAELARSVKESLGSDTMLYGNRTQAMFEAVVANLGGVKLVKREDAGGIYSEDDKIQAPDTRVVLADGRNLLVETKNYHGRPDQPFQVKTSYLDGLRAYAKMMSCPLRIAIFWSRGSLWTLVDPDAFVANGKWHQISVAEAFKRNDMGAVGDLLLGTSFPIVVRGYIQRRDGHARARPDKFRYFVADLEVLRPAQRRLLWFLAIWGQWRIDPAQQRVVEDNANRRIVDTFFVPAAEAVEQEKKTSLGWVLNSWLSTVLSRYWLQLTSTIHGEFMTLLPDRESWTDQLLEVTNEGEQVFAICSIASSLDPPSDRLAQT